MNKLFLVTLGTIHLSLYTVLADRVQAQSFTGSYTVFGQQSGSSVQTTTWESSINGVSLPTVTDTQTSSFSNVYPPTTYTFNGSSWSQTNVPDVNWHQPDPNVWNGSNWNQNIIVPKVEVPSINVNSGFQSVLSEENSLSGFQSMFSEENSVLKESLCLGCIPAMP